MTAGVGGLPTVIPDIPVSSVLILLYVGFAAANMAIFQIDLRSGRKFLPSVFLFAFCMARITTLVLRIVWATRQTNVRLSVAANVFVNAGILIVYVINLIFAQRILRAKQPALGWHMILRIIYRVLYAGVACALIMVITALVLSVYSLDSYTLQACRDIQLAAGTYLVVFTTLPVFILAAAYFLPRSPDEETFGEGRMMTKTIVVLAIACLAMLNSGFRAGTAWMPPRPNTHPAWYHGKAPFYVFNFTVEIIMLCILTPVRIDKLFHIPNGSKKPGDYSGRTVSVGSDRDGEKEGKSEDTTLNNV
ncbi:hypothetical protein AAE478_001325 [Parahypoxylon ruwenzoriense]